MGRSSGANVRGLDRTTRVFREERTRIRKGEIVKEWVWLDTFGNELEKVSDQPPTFNILSRKGDASPVIHGYDSMLPQVQSIPIELQFIPKKPTAVTQTSAEEDLWSALLMLASLLLVMASAFLLGYTVGRRQRKEMSDNMTAKRDGTGVHQPLQAFPAGPRPLQASPTEFQALESPKPVVAAAVDRPGASVPTVHSCAPIPAASPKGIENPVGSGVLSSLSAPIGV